MWNDIDGREAFDERKTTGDEWWNAKCVIDFIKPAAPVIDMAISVHNATLSFQDVIYKRLNSNCQEWMERDSTVGTVKIAARLLNEKLKKYERYLNADSVQLALIFGV